MRMLVTKIAAKSGCKVGCKTKLFIFIHNYTRKDYMKLLFFQIFVLLLGQVTLGSPLGSDANDISNRISLQGLKDIKHNLERELKSLVSPIYLPLKKTLSEPESVLKDDLLILPSNLLTAEIFEKLGLEFLNEDSFSFTLNDKEFKIPKDFKNIFLFNTSDSLTIPSSKHHNFANFIDQSLPFNLPEYMNLMNYYLVVPKAYLKKRLNLHWNKSNGSGSSVGNYSVAENCTHSLNTSVPHESVEEDDSEIIDTSSIYSRSILRTRISNLPIFRSVISENRPLMVFMFTDSQQDRFEKIKNPIMSIKNYLSAEKNLFSNFFDNFAQKWIKSVDYDSLISSVFCTTNSKDINNSYCLQIHDKRALYMFPAFKDISELVDLEKSDNQLDKRANRLDQELLETKVDAQTLRQVHDKLSILADKFNDVTYELATEPKPLIERVDERLDQRRYKINDKVDEKKDNIEDMKDALKQKILDKVNVIKSKLDFIENIKSDDYDLGDNPYNANGDNLVANLEKRNFLEENEPLVPQGGLMLPLSLIRTAEEKIATARNKKYSQVVFEDFGTNDSDSGNRLAKRFSIFSKDDINCEKITWYNVFHHSIFGKPEFCLEG